MLSSEIELNANQHICNVMKICANAQYRASWFILPIKMFINLRAKHIGPVSNKIDKKQTLFVETIEYLNFRNISLINVTVDLTEINKEIRSKKLFLTISQCSRVTNREKDAIFKRLKIGKNKKTFKYCQKARFSFLGIIYLIANFHKQ